MSEVTEIVLTGGPCAGKTTALSFLQEKLSEKGYRVLIVPEAATTFIKGGLEDIGQIAQNDMEKFFELQKIIFRHQLDSKEKFNRIAEQFPKEKVVILYDRGPMDSKAYLPEENCDEYMKEILKDEGFSLEQAKYYFDGVIHLVTAADGAIEAYTTENNEARREPPEKAKKLDKRTRRAWEGHKKLIIVDNATDFQEKMKRTLQATCSILGIPKPIKIERKFLLDEKPDFENTLLERAQKISIEQIYLKTNNEKEVRIRKRTQDSSTIY